MKTLIAYHGDVAVKKKYLDRVKAHRKADNLIKGTGWENGKGCAVGCTLEKYEHKAYDNELGIPRYLAQIEDAIFEGLPKAEAMLWPEQFLGAIKPGADLSLVFPRFMAWMLSDPNDGVIHFADERGKKAIRGVVDLFLKWTKTGKDGGYSARAAAENTARAAARAAAENTARAATYRRMAEKLIELLESA